MKVFSNTYNGSNGGWGGGVVLVAANSKEEAIRTYLQDASLGLQWSYYGIKTPETDFKNVSFDYYDLDKWKEVEGLTYSGDKPKVIIEDSYAE